MAAFRAGRGDGRPGAVAAGRVPPLVLSRVPHERARVEAGERRADPSNVAKTGQGVSPGRFAENPLPSREARKAIDRNPLKRPPNRRPAATVRVGPPRATAGYAAVAPGSEKPSRAIVRDGNLRRGWPSPRLRQTFYRLQEDEDLASGRAERRLTRRGSGVPGAVPARAPSGAKAAPPRSRRGAHLPPVPPVLAVTGSFCRGYRG